MSVATAPTGHFPTLRGAGRRLGSTIVAAAKLLSPAKPVLANLASVPLHAAGLGVFDFAAFHLPDPGFWGWAVTAVSLVWLEHVIADEP